MKAKYCLLAASGGLALFLADYPTSQWWLGLLAFAPLFWTVSRARTRREACSYGVAWGVTRVLPLAFMVDGFGLPWPARFALAGYVLGLDAAFALLAFWLRATAAGPILIAIVFAAIEYADSCLPMWGTGRSVARLVAPIFGVSWLIRLAGTAAVAVWLVSFQALIVAGVQRRRRAAVVAGIAVLVSVISTGVLWPPPTTPMLRVAAIGWGEHSGAARAETLVADASSQGARLVVFPEAAFKLLPQRTRASFEAEWSAIARKNSVFLVVPFLDWQKPGNKLLVFDATGAKLGEYTKQHLIPFAERFPRGDGRLLIFEVDGVRVGTMICQDDNFRDIARAYSERGAELLVVPTFEGPAAVAPYHFRNSVLRAIENPVALLRAAAQGESAVIAPGGRALFTFDHALRGTGVLTADIPLAGRGHGFGSRGQ
jgi:apolipoprotein N-acyltransferase